MSFQAPITISLAIHHIDQNHYLLPGIQREFIWGPDQVERLFDSLLRGYPISSFLFWRVEGEARVQHNFYRFLRKYRQKYHTHNEEIDTRHLNDFIAVLDGQQRLTALYIGLKGSYAYKRRRVWDVDNEYAYPTRKLYLDLRQPVEVEEDGRQYDFRFKVPAEAEAEPERWFEVARIMALGDDFEFDQYLEEVGIKKTNRFGWQALSKLKNAVHSAPIINYYLERDSSIDKALNIFIRINSGGEPLSYSDLVMSVAVSAWKKRKAREEIHGLVDEVLNLGFWINKDIVLRMFLLLHSEDVRFKTRNFTKAIAANVEEQWDKIRAAFVAVFRLLKFLGFNNSTLTSKNAVLPIVYYVINRDNAANLVEGKAEAKNRQLIARWLHILLLNQTMDTQSDRTLKALRDAMKDQCQGDFPAAATLATLERLGRKPKTDDEFLESLMAIHKDESMAFSILSLLAPSLGNEEWRFEKDHLHAAAHFTAESLLAAGVPEAEIEFCLNAFDTLPNLHLLAERENRSKQHRSLVTWLAQRVKETGISEAELRLRSLIPPEVSLELSGFGAFFAARKAQMKARLMQQLEMSE